MLIPNFDPFGFSRLSPRERMLQQLQGRGLGNFGLVQMLQGSNGGGQAGVLSSTNRLGMLAAGTCWDGKSPYTSCPEGCTNGLVCDTCSGRCVPPDFIGAPTAPPALTTSPFVMPMVSSPALRTTPFTAPLPITAIPTAPVVDPCTGLLCMASEHCDGGVCVPNKGVVETTNTDKPIDSPPVSTGTEETYDEGSQPDLRYAEGSVPDEVGQDWGKGRENVWEGEAPRGDPLLLPDENSGAGEDPRYAPGADVVAQQQTNAAALVQQPSRGIPWWGYALGAAAVGFGLYKFGGRKR